LVFGQLSGKADCDLIERRPRPILGRTQWPADVNKAGDALMRRQAKGIKYATVVGVPFGDPVCSVTERVRGDDKAHGGGAGGKHLLPFRDFHMRAGAAHHGDHQGRAHETLALGLDMFSLRVRILGAKCKGDYRTGRTPCFAFEHDEAPRCQPAVIRHP